MLVNKSSTMVRIWVTGPNLVIKLLNKSPGSPAIPHDIPILPPFLLVKSLKLPMESLGKARLGQRDNGTLRRLLGIQNAQADTSAVKEEDQQTHHQQAKPGVVTLLEGNLWKSMWVPKFMGETREKLENWFMGSPVKMRF